MKKYLLVVTAIFVVSFNSHSGVANSAGITANNPLNNDTTGAGSLAHQKQVYEQDLAQKLQSEYQNLRTYEEQLASLNQLRLNLAQLQSTNAGGLFRCVHGETNYIYDNFSGWSYVSGKVLQTLTDGVLVKPEVGTDIFVQDYPFQTVDDQQFDGCRAREDGVYSFIAVSGGRRTVKKMNYGVTVTPSKEALEREVAFVEYQIENHPLTLKAKADAAEKLRLAEKAKSAKERALKLNIEQAEAGSPIALRRMGERYRDGDGVEKDEAKSAEYFKKADTASIAAREKIEADEQAAIKAQQKQKFLWAIDQANKGAISGMILAGKCYHDGTGIEKDLTKAKEYLRKASDLGSAEAARLLETCE